MDQPGNHILLRGNQTGAADRMRELLARTVQDHVADQRSNAGALEDIRQRMEGLEWLVKEVREREVPGLAARFDGLAHHLDQAMQQAAGLGRVAGRAHRAAPHAGDAAGRAAFAVAGSEHVVGTVAENVEQALPRLQAVCDTAGQALEALRAQDERMARLQHSVGKLQQSMEAAAGRFSRLDKAVAELTQRTGAAGPGDVGGQPGPRGGRVRRRETAKLDAGETVTAGPGGARANRAAGRGWTNGWPTPATSSARSTPS